jgi:hypothetical protein
MSGKSSSEYLYGLPRQDGTQDKICKGSRVASAGTQVNVARQTTLQDVTYV